MLVVSLRRGYARYYSGLLVLLISAPGLARPNEDCVMLCDFGSKCVTQAQRCDHFPDCEDLADEDKCQDDCNGLRCANGDCVFSEHHCNGRVDCADGSDEMGCTSEDYNSHFKNFRDPMKYCLRPCNHGTCWLDSRGIAQCSCHDGFSGPFCDKSNSTAKRTPLSTPIVTTSGSVHDPKPATGSVSPGLSLAEFYCGLLEQKPLPQHLICNGNFDCPDRSDEKNCTLRDYERAMGPSRSGSEWCLMRCDGGECRFDHEMRAYCKCTPHFTGTFCEDPEENDSVDTDDDHITQDASRTKKGYSTDVRPQQPTVEPMLSMTEATPAQRRQTVMGPAGLAEDEGFEPQTALTAVPEATLQDPTTPASLLYAIVSVTCICIVAAGLLAWKYMPTLARSNGQYDNRI